jgi:hypothetical protein
MLNTFSIIVLSLVCAFSNAYAQLIPISESELSDMTGQAFINIDRSSSSGLDFTRLTFGLDVKTSLNSDLVELGKYDRAGEAAGTSDIRISDFALGHIDSNGNIVPFEISDPFIELAFDTVNGKENLVGVRLGFGGALGKLSGNIETLTGNIDVNVYGTGSQIAPNMSCGFFDLICEGAKALVGGTWADDQFKAKSYLVDSNGNSDPVRANLIGMLNGQTLSMPGSSEFENFIVGFLESNNCELSGTSTCFPLANFKSLDIGNNGSQSEGLFLSFQTQTVTWQDGSTSTAASEGAFMNIPNGGINVSFQQAFDGIPRSRTKYVDPYFGGY